MPSKDIARKQKGTTLSQIDRSKAPHNLELRLPSGSAPGNRNKDRETHVLSR